MAEVLHHSRAGVQGPMTSAPPAQHISVAPHNPTFSPTWLPSGPEPLQGFAVDAGVRHHQAEQFVGAAAAAAEALGDDQIGPLPRRTPTGVAAPYQKPAAQRSAERAVRPWEPVSGLGERMGAPHLKVPGANAGVQAFAAPDAPSLFVAPTAAQVEAVATAAERVARSGQGQPGAEGAYAPRSDAPVRELWPATLFSQQPKYCTACRAGHDPANERNPTWQPYTPGNRLSNLQLLDTRFRRAMRKGVLCCTLSDAHWEPVRWTTQPTALAPEKLRQQLALAFEGVREGHEPFRFLASRAVEGLLEAASDSGSEAGGRRLVEAVPELVGPIKLCLNTMQPQLVGGLLLLLIRLLRCHPAVPAALAPYARHLLPTLAVFRNHRRPLELPAPYCLPPTGSFSGSAAPRESDSRACRVCGMPLYRDYDTAAARSTAAADPSAPPPARVTKPLPGRMCRRYTLQDLVEEVLVLISGGGGELGRRVVQNYIPAFDYYSPQDQPACITVEEILEQRAKEASAPSAGPRRRPRSAPKVVAGRRPTGAPSVTAAAAPATPPRPATAAGLRGAQRAPPPPRRRSGGGGDRPSNAWVYPGLTPEELARWDGIEFRDVPYGRTAQQEAPSEASRAGGAGGRGAPSLRISTPVPIFDSPHDPLYCMLSEQYVAVAQASYRKKTFVRAGGRSGGNAGVRRAGSGGGAPGANVNAEVPYKDSPAGIRRVV